MKHFEKRLPDAELEIMKVIWHNPCPISTSEVKKIIEAMLIHNASIYARQIMMKEVWD